MATNNKPQKLTKEEHDDIKLASSLVLSPLLNDQGIQALGELVQSAADLPAAVANAVFGALTQVRQSMIERQIPVSGKIWTAGGGVLDTVIEEICKVLAGVLEIQEASDPQFMQAVKEAVFEQMEQAEQGGGAQPQAQPQPGNLLNTAPPAQAPPQPQGMM